MSNTPPNFNDLRRAKEQLLKSRTSLKDVQKKGSLAAGFSNLSDVNLNLPQFTPSLTPSVTPTPTTPAVYKYVEISDEIIPITAPQLPNYLVITTTVETFSASIDGQTLGFINQFDSTNFNNCSLTLQYNNTVLSANRTFIPITYSSTVSTIEDNLYTIFYVNTGSLIVGISLSSTYIPPITSYPEPSVTPSITPTITPSKTPTNTPTRSPGITPTITPTNTPTRSPGITPGVTPTQTSTQTSTPATTPTNTPTRSPSITPTNTPTRSPGITPSTTPTITPTITQTLIIPGYENLKWGFNFYQYPNSVMFDVPNIKNNGVDVNDNINLACHSYQATVNSVKGPGNLYGAGGGPDESGWIGYPLMGTWREGISSLNGYKVPASNSLIYPTFTICFWLSSSSAGGWNAGVAPQDEKYYPICSNATFGSLQGDVGTFVLRYLPNEINTGYVLEFKTVSGVDTNDLYNQFYSSNNIISLTALDTNNNLFNKWNHIALTHDNDTRTIQLFINGVLSGTKTYSPLFRIITPELYRDVKYQIDNNWDGLSYNFGGWSNNILGNRNFCAIYAFNKVLNLTELSYLYNNGNGRLYPSDKNASEIAIASDGIHYFPGNLFSAPAFYSSIFTAITSSPGRINFYLDKINPPQQLIYSTGRCQYSSLTPGDVPCSDPSQALSMMSIYSASYPMYFMCDMGAPGVITNSKSNVVTLQEDTFAASVYTASYIPLNITTSGLSYSIDQFGTNNPQITCFRGSNYDFILDTVTSHPMALRAAPGDTTTVITGAYNNNIVSGTKNSRIMFTPAQTTPDVIYYQCTVHSAMSGIIIIKDY